MRRECLEERRISIRGGMAVVGVCEAWGGIRQLMSYDEKEGKAHVSLGSEDATKVRTHKLKLTLDTGGLLGFDSSFLELRDTAKRYLVMQ